MRALSFSLQHLSEWSAVLPGLTWLVDSGVAGGSYTSCHLSNPTRTLICTVWQPGCRLSILLLKHAGMTPCIPVSNWSWASVALAFFMHQLWCFFNVQWGSIHISSHLVASLLYLTKPFPSHIFAFSFRCSCPLWPLQLVKIVASVVAVSNSSSCLSGWSMLTLGQASCILTSWCSSLPVVTHPTLSMKDRPLTPEIRSSTD